MEQVVQANPQKIASWVNEKYENTPGVKLASKIASLLERQKQCTYPYSNIGSNDFLLYDRSIGDNLNWSGSFACIYRSDTPFYDDKPTEPLAAVMICTKNLRHRGKNVTENPLVFIDVDRLNRKLADDKYGEGSANIITEKKVLEYLMNAAENSGFYDSVSEVFIAERITNPAQDVKKMASSVMNYRRRTSNGLLVYELKKFKMPEELVTGCKRPASGQSLQS